MSTKNPSPMDQAPCLCKKEAGIMCLTHRRERDLAFIKDDLRWPNLLLPLKRFRDGQLETAYLKDPVPVIYFGNIFSAMPKDPKKEYPSMEAIIDDGWVVD